MNVSREGDLSQRHHCLAVLPPGTLQLSFNSATGKFIIQLWTHSKQICIPSTCPALSLVWIWLMSMCDNSTSVFTTQPYSPNKAFPLGKAFPPQLNYLFFQQSFVPWMFRAAQEETTRLQCFSSAAWLYLPILFGHQTLKDTSAKLQHSVEQKTSQCGCAPTRGSFHEHLTHLASFSSDFDSYSLKREQWLDGKQSKRIHSRCWYVLELLCPHLE